MSELINTSEPYQPTLDMFEGSHEHRRSVPTIEEILAYHDGEALVRAIGGGAVKSAESKHSILATEQFWATAE